MEAVLVEEATAAAASVEGLLGDPPPVARFSPGFGDSSLDFGLVVHVRSHADQAPVLAALRKRILARFRHEGIALSLPQRVLQVDRLPCASWSYYAACRTSSSRSTDESW